MAAPMRKSMGSMRHMFVVLFQVHSKSGLHTSCCSLLRKRRGVSRCLETRPKTNNEAFNMESPSKPFRAEVIGASPNIPPDPQGPEQERSRWTLGEKPLHAADSTERGSWLEMSNGVDSVAANVIPRYTKAGPDDKRLGRAAMLAKSRKYREKSGKIILEGQRLIADALESGAKADTIFFSQVSNIEGLPLADTKINLVKVAYKDISLWSDVSTPQGIVGVFHRPKYENLSLDEKTSEHLPVSLICDNIRDPGNLGTILRSAAAAACQKILLTKGCVDVWEPKVLRSGAGAHFRVPIISNVPWSSIPNYLPPNRSVHIADCNYAQNSGLQTWRSNRNAAYRYLSEDSEGPLDGDDEDISGDPSERTDMILQATRNARTVPYFSVNWTSEACAVVIGGETEGLCREAEELCTDTGGRRIFIPMSVGVDSLNAAMATSVILFEAKRQHLMADKRH